MCYEESNYRKDTRVIRQLFRRFDVYIANGHKQGFDKTRPYVVIQKPLPNSTFLMCAPIRTPHEDTPITDANVKEYVKFMREAKGRIYVPIIMDNDGIYRMIDLTNQLSLHIGDMYKYLGTLIDENIIYNIEFELDFMHGRTARQKDSIDSVKFVQEINQNLDTGDEEKVATRRKYELEDLKIPSSKRGRPSVIDDKLFYSLYLSILNGEMDIYQAIKISGAKASTFKSRKKRMDELNGFTKEADNTLISTTKMEPNSKIPLKIPAGFTVLYRGYKNGTITLEYMSKKLKLSEEYCQELIERRDNKLNV